MTNPANAHATDNGRYYVHPKTGETWPSITNITGCGVSKPALPPTAAKITADWIFENLPYCVRKSRAQRDTVLKEAKAQYKQVWEYAKDSGTRVHARAEAIALGKAPVEDPEVDPFAKQLLTIFDVLGVDLDRDVEASEATVINRTHGYAGTGDLWVQLRVSPDLVWTPRKRWLWLWDYKSSLGSRPPSVTYPENDLQLAALANAESLLLDDGTEVAPPGPIAATAVVNLRRRGYAIVPTPFDRESAFAAFLGALDVTKYLHGPGKERPKPLTLTPPTATKKKDVA